MRTKCYQEYILLVYKLVFFSSPEVRSSASIIVRGANDFFVDEMERSLHDALCVVKRVLEYNEVVPGGGAVETALSVYLENFATSIVSSRYSSTINSIFFSSHHVSRWLLLNLLSLYLLSQRHWRSMLLRTPLN